MLSEPVVGGLVNKYGCRPVCITGAVVSWAAFSASTLSPNIPVLMLTYGVVGGFGLGLIYLPAIVSVGFYFESKRRLLLGFLFADLELEHLCLHPWQTGCLSPMGGKFPTWFMAAFVFSVSSLEP